MKIRSSFVANSSSSSFLIVGQFFNDKEEAQDMQEKITNTRYVHYIEGLGGYAAGIDIDPGLADGCEGDATELIKEINDAFAKVKAAGIENPKYYGYAGYDG